MSSIYHNLKSDKQYKAGSGLSKFQFEQIFKAFDKLYFPKIGNPYVKDKAPVLTDKKEALFYITINLTQHYKIWDFILGFLNLQLVNI